MIVDEDGRITWADDTALALHEVRTLKDLGGSAEGYARRFQLAYLDGADLPLEGYPIQRLLDGHVIDRMMIRVTRRADGRQWVHEVRTMALTDPSGHPDCLVVILNDETERFNAEARFERAFGANPAPAIIVRLGDLRYVKVNRGFIELSGFTEGALIGRSMHEIDILRGAENHGLALERLHAGKTIPQMEGSLTRQDGGERIVLLAGQPIEIGDQACMLFTFADLHPRKQVEDALRRSEERFAKAFHMAPGPMVILALKGLRIMDVNAAFTAATGWRREEVVGRDEAEVKLWGEGEQPGEVKRQISRIGQIASLDVQVRAKNGTLYDYLLSADTVDILGERCLLCVMLDITERKQTETELVAAVQAVMQDTSWLGQKIVEKLTVLTRSKGSGAQQLGMTALPARAQEVLELVAQGLGDEEIAAQLHISRNTLRNHIAAIYKKIGLHKRSAVVVWARERGLGAAVQSDVKVRKSGRPKKKTVRSSR